MSKKTLLLIIFILLFSLHLIFSKECKENFKYRMVGIKKMLRALFMPVFIIAVFLFLNIILGTHVIRPFELVSDVGNMYSQKFTDTIISGHVYLDDDTVNNLLALDNPYNPDERNNKIGNDYLWDASFYNGNYYLYFGIVPALLLFVPIKLITGKYLTVAASVLIFSSIYIISLGALSFKIGKRFLKELPCMYTYIFMIITLSSSGVIYMMLGPGIYEMCTISGFMFVSLGFLMYMIFNEPLLKKSESKNANMYKSVGMFLLSICLACAVGCRPTMLFSYIILIPFFINDLRSLLFLNTSRSNNNKDTDVSHIQVHNNNANFISKWISFIIPSAIIGILIMYYNYIRFDNPFEFGITYQLTVQDMSQGFDLFAFFNCIKYGLIKLPEFIADFPHITSPKLGEVYFGSLLSEEPAISMLALSPIIFIAGIFIIIYIAKKYFVSNSKSNLDIATTGTGLHEENKHDGKSATITFSTGVDKKFVFILFFMVVIVGFIDMIMLFSKAGIVQRYIYEPMAFLTFGLTCMLFLILKYFKIECKLFIRFIACLITLYTFFINLYTAFLVAERTIMIYCPDFWEKLQDIFL